MPKLKNTPHSTLNTERYAIVRLTSRFEEERHMDLGIAAVAGIMVVAMLVMAGLHIRAGIPTKAILENDEYGIVHKKGYKNRRRTLQRFSALWLTVFVLLVLATAWAIPALVNEMRFAPYNFATGQVDISGVVIAEALLSVVGAILAFVLWVRAFRRLRVVKAMPQLEE